MSSSETALAFFCFCLGMSFGVLFTAFVIFLYLTSSNGRRALEATNAECDASDALDPIRMAVARGNTNSQLTEDAQTKIRNWVICKIAFNSTHPWAAHMNPFRDVELRLKKPKKGG